MAGGGFVTATTGKPTDLTTDANTANTASPVVSSASYNFVPGDAGHWIYVAAGTSWLQGWYFIVSVASNKATLNGTIGAAVLANGTPSTAVGCASVGTPTGGTWSIDYSQVSSIPFSLTGLTTAAANAIILTASATKAMVGGLLIVTGGTNWIVGTYAVQACTAGVSLTVDRNCTTAAGLAGTAGLGGAFASPGMAGSVMVAGNDLFVKTGTYTVTSATANIASGCLTTPGAASVTNLTHAIGYGTVRGDGTRPTIQSDNVITTFTLIRLTANDWMENLILNGRSSTSSRGVLVASGGTGYIYNCKGLNFTNSAFVAAGSVPVTVEHCEATTCSTVQAFLGVSCKRCYSHDNTAGGFSDNSTAQCCFEFNISANNTGSSSDGFNIAGTSCYVNNNTAYGNGRDGFRITPGSGPQILADNLATGSIAGWGINQGSAGEQLILRNNATFGNFLGGINTANIVYPGSGNITLTADPFTNAAGGDFSLNATAGGGASCRAAGIPGAFPGLSATVGWLDIGAVQHLEGTRAYASVS